MNYQHPECPAYDVSLAIARARRHGHLLAVGMSRQGPAAVVPRRRVRVPAVAWLGWIVAAALLLNVLGCGAPVSRAGSPSSAGTVGAALPQQVDEVGQRLVAGRARVENWESFQRGLRYGVDPAASVRGMP